VAKATLKVVPASGNSTERLVEVKGTGCSVRELLDVEGYDLKRMQISVNGEPAALNSHVGEGAVVTLTEPISGS
jgi:hypothetical protein